MKDNKCEQMSQSCFQVRDMNQHALYRYAISLSCCGSSRAFKMAGMSVDRVELRMERTAAVVRFFSQAVNDYHSINHDRRTLASSTPSPYGQSVSIVAKAPDASPLSRRRASMRDVQYETGTRNRVRRGIRSELSLRGSASYISACGRMETAHLDNKLLTSALLCLASVKTPSGPRGSGSYRSDGTSLSSSY